MLLNDWYFNVHNEAAKFPVSKQITPVVMKVVWSEFVLDHRNVFKLTWFSDPFYTHEKGYKAKLAVDVHCTLGCDYYPCYYTI